MKEYTFEVVNDELVVTDEEGKPFTYTPGHPESQRVQEALFHEKQSIIENCLFGVDINPNSVKICRLRLWIELLKNAYYTGDSTYKELETLPNIDINIKCGNSLISRYSLDADLKQLLKKSKSRWTIATYRNAIHQYQNARTKEEKNQAKEFISTIKSDFQSNIVTGDPRNKRLKKLLGDLMLVENKARIGDLFDKLSESDVETDVKKLKKQIAKLENELEEVKNNKIYENAFEWRFEFPEVLDDDGEFVGFDVVIGNPPYVRQEEFSEIKQYLRSNYIIYHSIADLLTYFVERGLHILKKKGVFQYIISNKFTRSNYGERMRMFLLKNSRLTHFIDFSGYMVFDEATVDAAILGFRKTQIKENRFLYANMRYNLLRHSDFATTLEQVIIHYDQAILNSDSWSFGSPEILRIKNLVESKGKPLREWYLNIYFGIKTGYNKAFVITEEKHRELVKTSSSSSAIIKPLLRGRDLKRYSSNFQNMWLIATFPSLSLNIDRYPAVKEYLKTFGRRLYQSGENGERKKTSNNWYETQDTIAFWKELEKPKLIWKRIGSKLRFCYDEDNLYCLDSTCIATGNKLKYLCALLNSKLCRQYLFWTAPKTGVGDLIISVQALEPLPVIVPNDEQLLNIEELFDKMILAQNDNNKALITGIENEIDSFVYKLYGLKEQEIEIIENSPDLKS